jgi:hypothetical protein
LDLFLVIVVAADEDIIDTLQDGSVFGKFEGGKNEGDIIDISIEKKVRSLG